MSYPKFAIIIRPIRIRTVDGDVWYAANAYRPFQIDSSEHEQKFRLAHEKLGLVLIADKATLLANPVDLCEDDFANPIIWPSEDAA